MLVAGIDEAGYGPILGPLVVTGTVFAVPDDLACQSLWKVLANNISNAPTRGDLRLPIADSKKLHNRKSGLCILERTALAMLATTGRKPETLASLLKILSPDSVKMLGEYPWYREYDHPIPRTTSSADIATRTTPVAADMANCGINLSGIFTELMPAGHFNRRVGQTRNKATLLMEMVLKTVQRILVHGKGHKVSIHADRQGGRTHYRDTLMTFFQGSRLRIVDESDTRSAYELATDNHEWFIEFITEGEERHLPIALASIFCKYIRESLMTALNEYFCSRIATLKPTAGYYTDGKRFLSEIESTAAAEHIDNMLLVRSR